MKQNVRSIAFLCLVLSIQPAVARAALTYDETFDDDGRAVVDFAAGLDAARDLEVQADGRYVLVGLSRQGSGPTTYDYAAVTRLDEDGVVDDSFGVDGRRTYHPGPSPMTYGGADARGVAIQGADQKIVVVGSWNVNDGFGNDVFVMRLEPDGDPDPDFGTGGFTILDLAEIENATAEAVALQSDGGIIVCGGAGTKAFILRVTSGGELDTSFAGDGVLAMQNPATAGAAFSLRDLVILGDDAIVAAGGGEDFVAVRVSADGEPEASFGGGDGIAHVNYDTVEIGDVQIGTFDDASAVALQSDGRIVLAGSIRPNPLAFNVDAALVRLTAAGALDTSFGIGGFAVLPDHGNSEAAYDLVVRETDDVITAGLGIAPTQIGRDGKSFAYAQPTQAQAVLGLRLLDAGRVVGAGEQNVAATDYRFFALRLDSTELVDPVCGACGDVSGDCKTTAVDALAALRIAVGTLPYDPLGDFNGDGKVTATEALAILKIAVGQSAAPETCGT